MPRAESAGGIVYSAFRTDLYPNRDSSVVSNRVGFSLGRDGDALFPYVFSDWLYRGLVFLVISCPCALVISVPLGYFGGIGAASRAGILFKGGNYLDAITRVNTVAFDKTGTLTTGRFEVTTVESTESRFLIF